MNPRSKSLRIKVAVTEYYYVDLIDISVDDNIEYDHIGNMTKEQLKSGDPIDWTYDIIGNPIDLS